MPTALTEPHSGQIKAIADRIRNASITATSAAGSGHPTSSLSCADLIATLFFRHFQFDIEHPDNPANDRFVLSKGHAVPALWAALAEAGAIPSGELTTLRDIDSDLEGHPTPRQDLIDVPTGSLGQGLSMGLGMALWSLARQVDNQVWVLLGDGECAEGSIWEAAMLADNYHVDGLCALVDVNALGQTGETMFGSDAAAYSQRFEAFGWSTSEIDGHDIEQISAAMDTARRSNGPHAIIARTHKGSGVDFLEDEEGRHGKALQGKEARNALAQVGFPPPVPHLAIRKPEAAAPAPLRQLIGELPTPDFSGRVATRTAFGAALAEVVDRDERVLVFDGDVGNSTGADTARERCPQRFIQSYIAEQNMAGMAHGSAAIGSIPCVSNFAAFLSRAADQFRMVGIGGHHMLVAGTHAGVVTGADGPSQMGLEDVALFRSISRATVLCPSDAVSCYHLLPSALLTQGLVYMRLARPDRPLLYDCNDRDFGPGRARVLRSHTHDCATIVASGVCVHEALAAAERLAAEGILVGVIDAYSIEPLDVACLSEAAEASGHLICVEDHYRAGGLGEAVAGQVLPEVKQCGFSTLTVHKLPRSGDGMALMAHNGIDVEGIYRTAKGVHAAR
ncbi:MAG: transketolase [Planctomycetota bacterium]|jgi:transketolase|nr:transketolase [Planctomycetota bacterium]